MLYDIKEIECDARIALNENPQHEEVLPADSCQLSLSAIIRAQIVPAARQAILEAPLELLGRGHDFADAPVCWEKEGCGYALLPRDFCRLIAFEMSDWDCAVFEAITPLEHPDAYALQRSAFRGLRGTPQMPVCALVNRPEALVLEFYSCQSSEACIVRAQYAPQPFVDEQGRLDLPPKLYDALISCIAAKTKEILCL